MEIQDILEFLNLNDQKNGWTDVEKTCVETRMRDRSSVIIYGESKYLH